MSDRTILVVDDELADLAIDVNALAEALAKTEQQRSRLMSDLARELRTPLTTIQGYMEGLIDGVFEPTAEVYAEVAEGATRLKRLTADLAHVSVHDTGEGIPPSELEHIFERFHRVEGEGVVYAGSGVGLTISRTIIRSHQGEITVDSPGRDRGSTFTVRLPRLDS